MQIRRIEIEGFRGIRKLNWTPGPGINFLLGPGDTGKTTVLDAIALALSPQPSQAANESDYWNLDTSEPFRIGLVLGALSAEFVALAYPAPLWGWDSVKRQLLNAPDEEEGVEAVMVVQLTGTADLELQHRILQPGADERGFSVSHRVAGGLWNVSTSRIAGSQLRVNSGSLLERAVGRGTLRAPAAAAMHEAQGLLDLPEGLAEILSSIQAHLEEAGVEIDGLRLGLVPSPGQSPVQLIALVATKGDGQVPLASFGRGSQQMAMLALAAAEVSGDPVAVVDEIETGLEPYRQRALLGRLRAMVSAEGQAFITTHSPTVLSLTDDGEGWRLRGAEAEATVRQVTGTLHRALVRDPEVLLCRLPFVCEGATEIGMVRALYSALGSDIDALGVRLVDGKGQESSLELIECLAEFDIPVWALVDNENSGAARRERVGALAQVHLWTPAGGRCTEIAVANATPADALQSLLELPGTDPDFVDVNARTAAVIRMLGAQSESSLAELLANNKVDAVRDALGRAAVDGKWFKSLEGGNRLGRFVLEWTPPDGALRVGLSALVDSALDHLHRKSHAPD